MPEEQDIPKQSSNEDSHADLKVQALASPSPESQLPNMEVHHHPDLHHKKKKFREYFLEFLMIFLAVTLGFFAESLREHLSDNKKEEEYIKLLIADLHNDQQTLAQEELVIKSEISMMDSIVRFLDNPSLIPKNSGELYWLARIAPRIKPLSINNRTFEQLKNSGNFRLIKNIAVSDRIMAYYEKIRMIRQLEDIHRNEFDEYKKVAARVFDPAIFFQMQSQSQDINRTSENPPLRTMDSELLKELSIFSIYMNGSQLGVLDTEKDMKATGASLLAFLKNEYHIGKD
jgi:cell division protein FtsB